jgi:hypothetical protein
MYRRISPPTPHIRSALRRRVVRMQPLCRGQGHFSPLNNAAFVKKLPLAPVRL